MIGRLTYSRLQKFFVVAFLMGSILELGAAQLASKKSPILYDALPDPSRIGAAFELGAMPVLVVYQSVDPASSKSARIDRLKVLQAIEVMFRGGAPQWGLLDFEEPFFEHLASDPDGSQYRSAASELIELITAVRARFPGTKWSLYGIPSLPYWYQHQSWDVLPRSDKQRLLEACIRASQALIDACDWVCPSVYMFYDPELFKGADQPGIRAAGRIWRAASVRIAKLMAKGKLVIPVTSPLWTEVGKAKSGYRVPAEQFQQDALDPICEAGADGIMIWTALNWRIDSAIMDTGKKEKLETLRDQLLPKDAQGSGDVQLQDQLKEAAGNLIMGAIQAARTSLERGMRKAE